MRLVTMIFDLETGMPVTSQVRNLPSKFGHARGVSVYFLNGTSAQEGYLVPFNGTLGLSVLKLLFAMYVMDRQTDGRAKAIL